MDRNFNNLLKWSIENSVPSTTGLNGTTSTSTNGDHPPPSEGRSFDPEILNAILGGPSDAELMQRAMVIARTPTADMPLSAKLMALDDLEQLIENLDNANNMGVLALWEPLLGLLEDEAHEVRRMAAWCLGTAVQNNQQSQAKLLEHDGVTGLVRLAAAVTEEEGVRRKAVYAVSSAVRNYQPAMDVLVDELEKLGQHDEGKVDAADMEAVDAVINRLRERASGQQQQQQPAE